MNGLRLAATDLCIIGLRKKQEIARVAIIFTNERLFMDVHDFRFFE
jgi:hypothetical protein